MTDNTNKRATAVDFARRQIGKPYSFGAAGPSSWDCSGLTMRAWEAVGFSLPHNTGAQYVAVQKIPLSQASPGDLVFFGGYNPVTGEPHHVGLYVGPNQMIDAPDYGIPVGVHDYTTYGDVMQYAGRMPVDGLTTATIVDTSVSQNVTVTPAASITGTYSAITGFFSNLLYSGGTAQHPGHLWARVGLGVLGVVVLFLLVKWMG